MGGDACMGWMDDVCTSDTDTYSGYITHWYCYEHFLAGEDTPDCKGAAKGTTPEGYIKDGCLAGPAAC
eukprot:4196577-Amphidinium_carterae.1